MPINTLEKLQFYLLITTYIFLFYFLLGTQLVVQNNLYIDIILPMNENAFILNSIKGFKLDSLNEIRLDILNSINIVFYLISFCSFILIYLNPGIPVTIQRSVHLSRQMLYNLRNQLYHSHF